MTEVAPKTILIVDDDETLRSRLARAFSHRGWITHEAEGYESAVAIFATLRPERAVIDLKMPGPNGLELLKRMQELSPRTAVVMLTGYGSITNAVEAIKLGAVNYVTKPADADQVLLAFHGMVDAEEESYDRPDDFSPPSLAVAEWEHIQRVLSDCGGNISEAARLLDIPRRTLQRKLKKMPP